MEEQKYIEAIDRTMNEDLTENEKLSMLALGIAGEAGEIVDTIKKIVYHGHELDIEELTKELGDLNWYIQHLMKHYGISNNRVRLENIVKLNKRYVNGFSEEASRNRKN